MEVVNVSDRLAAEIYRVVLWLKRLGRVEPVLSLFFVKKIPRLGKKFREYLEKAIHHFEWKLFIYLEK